MTAEKKDGWIKRKVVQAGNDLLLVDRQAAIIGSVRADLRRMAGSGRTYRHETFDQAIDRLQLSDADLAARHKDLCTITRIMHAGGLGAMLLMLYAAWTGNVFQFVSAIAVAGICFVAGSLNAFRAWQIERRELGGWAEWLRSPELWVK